VSTHWQELLRSAWTELAQHPAQKRQFRTQLLSESVRLCAYAGRRAVDDAPCLLIQTILPIEARFELGGMRLDSTLGEEGPLLVLSLEDANRADLFTTVCADAISAAELAVSDEALTYYLARLEAWRRFLRERDSGLTRNEAVGLIGELLVLARILDHNRMLQSTWESPDDGLHDFKRTGHSLEVKTNLGPASTVHISSLDQLDLTGLRRLELIHIRLIEAPDGQNLGDLISEVEQVLPDAASRNSFSNALLRRGLMPDDAVARSSPRVQLRSLIAYTIDDKFPKLVRATLPAAVIEAEYELDLRAISSLTTVVEAVLAEFAGGVT
jgi:hypothetical protein